MTEQYETTLYEIIFLEKKMGILSDLIHGSGIKGSNKIITDLIKRIEKFGQKRGMDTEYEKIIFPEGEFIKKATMRSKDGVIQGAIEHIPYNTFPDGELDPAIRAVFKFNSKDKSLEEEYLELFKIIRIWQSPLNRLYFI